MPVGFRDFLDPPDDQELFRIGQPVGAPAQLPLPQVDPFVRGVAQLRNLGLLTDDFLQRGVARELLAADFIDTGQIRPDNRNLFQAGQAVADENLLRELENIRDHTVDQGREISTFIPKEQTEPGGFLRLLEFFGVFNYAIAGSINALINAAHGRKEEANPFIEFLDGFTLKDKETFQDVLENLGWRGEDGISYWSRWTLGLATDIVVDPLNFFLLGSAQAGARILGLASKIKFRRGRVLFDSGLRDTPLKAIERISDELLEEGVEALRRGDDVVVSGNTATQRAAFALKQRVSQKQAQAELTVRAPGEGLAPVASVIGAEGVAQGEALLLRQFFKQDVHQAIATFFRGYNVDFLEQSFREVGDDMAKFFARIGDGEFSMKVGEKLLALDGQQLTIRNLKNWFDQGYKKFLDPGGLKIDIPFTSVEIQVMQAEWMDVFKAKLQIVTTESLGRLGKFLGSTFSTDLPGPRGTIGRVASIIGQRSATVFKAGLMGVKRVGQLFGTDRRRSQIFESMLIERNALLHKSVQNSMEHTEATLLYEDPVGKIKREGKTFSRLDDTIQEVVYDHIQLESDAAREWIASGKKYFDVQRQKERAARLLEAGDEVGAQEILDNLGAAAKEAGYEERYIPQIRNDPRLAGYSDRQLDAAENIGREMERIFRDQYDLAVEAGLDVAYLDYYLPIQYKNIESSEKLRFSQRQKALKGGDQDPFIRLRTMTLKEAKEEFGLEPIKDLGQLLFGRLFAGQRAQIERQFAQKFIDAFAIHQGQIDDLLVNVFGAQGQLGTDILRATQNTLPVEDLFTERGILQIIPALRELKDLFEQGKMDEAVEWFERTFIDSSGKTRHNYELLGPGLVFTPDGGSVSLFEAFRNSGLGGVAAVNNHLDRLSRGQFALAGRLADDLAEFFDEFTAGPGGIVGREGAEEGSDLVLAQALSVLTERRMLKRLGLELEVGELRVRDLLAEGRVTSGSKSLDLGPQAGIDAVHTGILDEMMTNVDPRVTDKLLEALEQKHGARLDQAVDELVELIDGVADDSIGGVTARTADFDTRTAVLTARLLWPEVLETSVTRGERILTREFRESQLRSASREIKDLLSGGRKEEAQEVANRIYDELGTEEILGRVERKYRQDHPMPDTPLGDLSEEVRAAVVSTAEDTLGLVPRARKAGKEIGVKFFRESLFVPASKSVRGVRNRVKSRVKSAIGTLAGKDEQLFEQLLDLVFQRAGSRAGFHYQPIKGLKGALASSYAGKVNRFLDTFRRRAREASPEALVEVASLNKLEFDHIVRDTLRAPLQMTVVLEKILQKQTEAVGLALRRLAQVVGSDTYTASRIAGDLSDGLDRVFRIGPSSDLTKAHEQVEEVFGRFRESVADLLQDHEMGQVLTEMIDGYKQALIDTQNRIGNLMKGVESTQTEFRRILSSPSGFYGVRDIADLRTAIDDQVDQIRELMRSIEIEADRVFQEPIPPAGGRVIVKQLLRDDPVVGNFLRVVEDLRGDAQRLPRDVAMAQKDRMLRQARAHVNNAEDVVRRMQAELEEIRPALEAPLRQVRVLEDVADGVVERGRLYVNSILEEVMGAPVDIFDEAFDIETFARQVSGFKKWRNVDQGEVLRVYVGMALADEFMRAGKMTDEAWSEAAERLFTVGPANPIFREFWEKSLANLRTEGLRDLVEDFFLSTAPSRLRTGRVRTEFEWAAINRLSLTAPEVGHEQIAGRAFDVWNKNDEVRELLDVDDSFRETVVTRFRAILASRKDTTGWVEEWGDAAFLRPDELADMARKMKEEEAFIDAFTEVVDERRNVIAITEIEDARLEITQALLNDRKSVASGAELQELATTEANKIVETVRRGQPTAEDIERYAELGLTPATLRKVREGGEKSKQVQAFLEDLYLEIDSAFDDAFAQLDDFEGWREIRDRGAAQTIAGALRDQKTRRILALREGRLEDLGPEAASLADALRSLDPPVPRTPSRQFAVFAGETVADEARYMARLVPEKQLAGSAMAKRAQYWMWRLGFFTSKARKGTGSLGLPAKARVEMLRGIQAYGKSGEPLALTDGLVAKVRTEMTEVIQANEAKISALRLAETETSIFKQRIREITDSRSMNLQFGPENAADFNSVQHLRNYLNFQALRFEHAALGDLLRAMPTESERRAIVLKSLAQTPDEAEQLTARQLLGPGEFVNEDGVARTMGGALTEEQLRATETLGMVQWEAIEARLEEVLSRSGRRVLEKLNVDLLEHPTAQDFLLALEDRGVKGIEIIDGRATVVSQLSHPELPLTDELDSAINEILGYLNLNQGEGLPVNLNHMPATELQLRAVSELLESVVDNQELRNWTLYALSSTKRADRLTIREATYVIEQLEKHLSSKIGPRGRRITGDIGVDPDKLFEAQTQKGYVPEKLRKLADGGREATIKEAADVGTEAQLVTVSFPHMQNLVGRGGQPLDPRRTRFQIPAYLHRSLRDEVFQDRFVNNEALNGIFKNFFDPISNSFKELQTLWFPAFHTRNILDASIRAAFAIGVRAFDVKRNFRLWRFLRGEGGSMRVAGQDVPNDILREWVQRSGLKVDFGEKVGYVNVGLPGAQSIDDFHPLSENFIWRKLGGVRSWVRNIAGDGDNVFRVSIWLDAMEKGMPPTTAARFTQKFMFDYAYGLTPFERDVMRRLFPFYTFSRFNIPLALETMAKRPGVMAALGKTRYALGNSEKDNIENTLPPFVRERWRFFPTVEKGELRVYSGQNLVSLEDLSFLGDLATWRGEELRNGFFKEVVSRLNPLLKIVPEFALGRNFFFDSRIAADQTVKSALLDWPVLREFLEMRQVRIGTGADAQVYWRVNGRRMHFVQTTHLARIYRTLTASFGRMATGESPNAIWERFLPFITGVRLQIIDLERQRDHLIAVSNFNRAKILRALRQGDIQQARRIAGTADRSEEERAALQSEMQSLDELVEVPSYSF